MVLFDIVALMWLWDVSINSISIVNLVLAIGLAVDYSAHVAHAFMKSTGTNDERVVKALGEMGADVTHGVLSTFLAVVVMASSKSYIFVLFFRQFFGICLFGAFHGLMFLPGDIRAHFWSASLHPVAEGVVSCCALHQAQPAPRTPQSAPCTPQRTEIFTKCRHRFTNPLWYFPDTVRALLDVASH